MVFNNFICLMFFVYLKYRVESAHWALKRILQNTLRDLCSVWDAMNNMITLQHTEVKASFETTGPRVRRKHNKMKKKRSSEW